MNGFRYHDQLTTPTSGDGFSFLKGEHSHHHNHLDHSHEAFHKLQHHLKEYILTSDEVSHVSEFGELWRYGSSLASLEHLVKLLGTPTVMLRMNNNTKEKAIWVDVKLPGTHIRATVNVFSKPKLYFAKKAKLLTTSLSLKLKLNDHAVKHINKLFRCSTYNQATHMLTVVGYDLSHVLTELALILHLDEHFLTKDALKALMKVYFKKLKSKEHNKMLMDYIIAYLAEKIK